MNARRQCARCTSLQVRRTFCTATPPLPSYIDAAVALQTSPAKRSHNVSRPALGWIHQVSIAAIRALEASIDAAWHQRRQQNKEPHLWDAHLPCKKEREGSAIPSVQHPSQFSAQFSKISHSDVTFFKKMKGAQACGHRQLLWVPPPDISYIFLKKQKHHNT